MYKVVQMSMVVPIALLLLLPPSLPSFSLFYPLRLSNIPSTPVTVGSLPSPPHPTLCPDQTSLKRRAKKRAHNSRNEVHGAELPEVTSCNWVVPQQLANVYVAQGR